MTERRRRRSRLILVLGGASSGKSQAALELARGLAPRGLTPFCEVSVPLTAVPVPRKGGQAPGLGRPRKGASPHVSPRLAFVATGQALDQEMTERIKRHQVSRSSDWITAEVPIDLAMWFRKQGKTYRTIVLDCLTLWLSNLRGRRVRDSAIPGHVADLLDAIRATPARVVLVSNELGLGLVPATRAVRSFRDLAGRVNQQIAAEADEVYCVISGLPLRLK